MEELDTVDELDTMVKLDKIINQLAQVTAAKSRLENSLTRKIEGLEKTCKKLVTKVNMLQHVTEKQNANLKFCDFQVRRKNILLYGLREPEGETPSTLRDMIFELIERHLGLKMLRFEFDAIYRLGVKKSAYHKRPVIIKLINERKKRAIMRRGHLLRKYDLQLKDDYSREIIEKRRLLHPICERLRAENRGHVVLHQDKIYVNGQLYDVGKERMEVSDFKSDTASNNFSNVQDIQIVEEISKTPPSGISSNDIEILNTSTVRVKMEKNAGSNDVQIVNPPTASPKPIEVISL
uniref:Uncharacterized protein n=1 Tax=Cacopsylla melanoneura TaxID=428564 RepID=A0A8D8MBU9_9HEMI